MHAVVYEQVKVKVKVKLEIWWFVGVRDLELVENLLQGFHTTSYTDRSHQTLEMVNEPGMQDELSTISASQYVYACITFTGCIYNR